jgi:hypothetical protein
VRKINVLISATISDSLLHSDAFSPSDFAHILQIFFIDTLNLYLNYHSIKD